MCNRYILITVLGLCNMIACLAQSIPCTIQDDCLPIKPERYFTIKTNEGTCMDLDISPNDKHMVFTLLGNIFSMESEGGKAIQLTKGMAWDRHPKWSPDGKSIAYLSDATGNENIWLMEADGTNSRPITHEKLGSFIDGFEWSNSGKDILSNGTLYSVEGQEIPEPKKAINPIRPSDTLDLPYSRAILSPNQEWVAYINLKVWNERKQGANNLRIRNLITGEDKCLVCPIDHWRENWEQFTFSRDSKRLWIGYGGKIHRIDISTGLDTVIPFEAYIAMVLGPLQFNSFSIGQDIPKVSFIESGHMSPDGKSFVFSALSQVYIMKLPRGKPKVLTEQKVGQFSPKFSPDGSKIAYVTFEEDTLGNLWTVSSKGGRPGKLTPTEGYYQHPTWSPTGKWISVVKADGPYNIVKATKAKGTLLAISENDQQIMEIDDEVELDDSAGFLPEGQGMIFSKRKDNSYFKELQVINLKTKRSSILALIDPFAKEITTSPDENRILYRIGNSIYRTELTHWGDSLPRLVRPAKGMPIVKLNPTQGAHHGQWKKGGDGADGAYFISQSKIMVVEEKTTDDVSVKYGASKNRDIPYSINIGPPNILGDVNITLKKSIGEGIKALTGAKIVTMDQHKVYDEGVILVRGDRILDIGHVDSISIPRKSRIIDVTGKTIIPGLIDMHAHSHPPNKYFPKEWWAFNEAMNFGISTARELNSPWNGLGYRELIENGTIWGPRLFNSTAIASEQFQINSLEDAQFLARTEKTNKAMFLKVHDNFSRKQRQYLVIAAQEEGLNITGHASSINSSRIFNMSIILDGFTGREHILSHGQHYNDMEQLSRKAGIVFTPTLITYSRDFSSLQHRYKHLLNYPPIKGRHFQFSPSTDVDLWGKESRGFYYARNLASQYKKGVRITAGSHGDYPGLELHWEIWLLKQGGLSNYDALSIATRKAAEGLGLENDLGTLEKGKIADLLIMDKDPLIDIKNTLSIHSILKDGVLHPIYRKK